MSFFCVKTVKRKPSGKDRKNARRKEKTYSYVYEARTRRVMGKVKHDLIGKVGPLLRFDQKKTVRIDRERLSGLDKDCAIKEILMANLIAYGFEEEEDYVFEKEGVMVNLRNLEVTKKGKKVALAINGGYLCSKTLKNLFEFELVEQKDLPRLVKFARDIGLFPTTVEQNNDSSGVEGLINVISRAVGEGETQSEKEDALDNYKSFLSVLITKYPKFKLPANKEEEMGLKDFEKEFGW